MRSARDILILPHNGPVAVAAPTADSFYDRAIISYWALERRASIWIMRQVILKELYELVGQLVI